MRGKRWFYVTAFLIAMYYNWTDILFEIKGVTPEYNPNFDSFRKYKNLDNKVSIAVMVVKELPKIGGERITRIGKFEVYQEQNLEHRLFSDLWNDKPYAFLKEEEGPCSKTLYVLDDYYYRIETEIGLTNHLALERSMRYFGRMILHSSFIQTSEGAVLFSAPCGTGKSTQADLWNKYKESRIVNGDRSGIWHTEDGWFAGGVPWWGTSEITTNLILPLKAVVQLSQAPINVIEKVPVVKKIKKMIREVTVNPWNELMITQTQNDLLELNSKVAVVSLACRPDQGAVELLAETLGIK